MRLIEKQALHKILRDSLVPMLSDLCESEILHIGTSSIIYVSTLGFLVFKDHEITKDNEYFEEVEGIMEFSKCWIKQTPDEALRLISLDTLKEFVEDYELHLNEVKKPKGTKVLVRYPEDEEVAQ
jgi:hypothetical protein